MRGNGIDYTSIVYSIVCSSRLTLVVESNEFVTKSDCGKLKLWTTRVHKKNFIKFYRTGSRAAGIESSIVKVKATLIERYYENVLKCSVELKNRDHFAT